MVNHGQSITAHDLLKWQRILNGYPQDHIEKIKYEKIINDIKTTTK